MDLTYGKVQTVTTGAQPDTTGRLPIEPYIKTFIKVGDAGRKDLRILYEPFIRNLCVFVSNKLCGSGGEVAAWD
jgi:hypothetical protein